MTSYVVAPDRFWRKVTEGEVPSNAPGLGRCWDWIGSRSKGYGYYVDGGRNHPAYRWLYRRMVSPDIDGLDLDHLCRNPSCVNPWHLEPVSHQVNCQRGRNVHREKTHCPSDHPYDSANTYITPSGTRQCRICKRAGTRAYFARRRMARTGN